MFKAAKTSRPGPQKPGIWAEGAQFAPLSAGPLGRVSVILARQDAAKGWRKASDWLSDAALAMDDRKKPIDGHPSGLARTRAQVATVFVHLISRLSRLQASAAAIVDHQSEPVAPLEFSDLRGFMDQRRAAVVAAEREKLRKGDLGKSARDRAASLVRRPSPEISPDATADAPESSIPDLPETDTGHDHPPLPPAKPDKGLIDMSELLAIRAALASVPDALPAIAAPPQPSPIPPPPARLFATQSFPQEPEHQTLPLGPDVSRRRSNRLGSAASWVARAFGRAIQWTLHLVWRLVGPSITRCSAFCLGWGLVACALPIGLAKGVLLHAKGQDLRLFD